MIKRKTTKRFFTRRMPRFSLGDSIFFADPEVLIRKSTIRSISIKRDKKEAPLFVSVAKGIVYVDVDNSSVSKSYNEAYRKLKSMIYSVA